MILGVGGSSPLGRPPFSLVFIFSFALGHGQPFYMHMFRGLILSFFCFIAAFPLFLWGAQDVPALTWEDCLAEAAKYHPDLIIAKESVIQAEETVGVTRGNEWPSLDVSAGASRVRNAGASSNASSLDLVGTVTVFDGGAKRSATEQARAQLTATRQGYHVTSARLRFDLRAAYIGLWQAQEAVNIAQSILKIREDSYKLVKLHYESGTEHRGSLKLSEAKLAQAKVGLKSAQRDVVSAQVALSKAIGYPMKKPLQVVEIQLPHIPAEGPDMEAIAKAHPQYRQALAGEGVAAAGVRTSKAAYWPRVDVSASVGRQSNDFPPNDNQAAVGASVTYPLFNGGAREASVQRARSAVRSAQANTLSVYNSLYSTLQQAWSDLADAIDNAEVQAEFLEANSEREKIAQEQYNVGLTTYNDRAIIEDNLVSTEQLNLNTRAAALSAWAAWDEARGIDL